MVDDSRWRGTEHRWLGAMWGPIPVDLILWLAPLFFLLVGLYKMSD